MNGNIEFEWVMFESEVEPELNALVNNGASIEKREPYEPTDPEEIDELSHAAFEPIMMLVGVVAATFLIEHVVQAIKNYRFGGAVVDIQNGKVKIIPTRSVDAGTIVVARPDGEVEIHTSDTKPVDIIGSIKALIPGMQV